MKITECQINKVKNSKGSLVAFANITIDDELVIKGIKIVDGKKGLFVAMPCTQGEDGKYYDDVFPITKECREYLSEFVLNSYDDSNSKRASKKR